MAGDEQTDSSGKYGMNGNSNGPQGAAKYWPLFFKSFELILCILCIGLIDEPANNSRIRVFVGQRTVALTYSTFSTFLIVSAVFIFGKIVRDNWPWKTSALLSLIGTILFVACAGATLHNWVETKEQNTWPPNTQRLDLVCATGFICVITSIVFLIDLILTVRAGTRGDLGD